MSIVNQNLYFSIKISIFDHHLNFPIKISIFAEHLKNQKISTFGQNCDFWRKKKIKNSPKNVLTVIILSEYTNGNPSTHHARAAMMIEDNPKLKLIFFFCDPVKRSFSHVKQILAQSVFRTHQDYTDDDVTSCLNSVVNGLPENNGGTLDCGSFKGLKLNEVIIFCPNFLILKFLNEMFLNF